MIDKGQTEDLLQKPWWSTFKKLKPLNYILFCFFFPFICWSLLLKYFSLILLGLPCVCVEYCKLNRKNPHRSLSRGSTLRMWWNRMLRNSSGSVRRGRKKKKSNWLHRVQRRSWSHHHTSLLTHFTVSRGRHIHTLPDLQSEQCVESVRLLKVWHYFCGVCIYTPLTVRLL